MQVMILDGSRSDNEVLYTAKKVIDENLKKLKWQSLSYILRDHEISPCTGCFWCWVKTPGKCVINDIGQEICEQASRCDVWLLLTPVSFGAYSKHLKKAIDRILPLITPIIVRENNETHHELRYQKPPALLVVGCATPDNAHQENLFREYVKRNAINFHSPIYKTYVLRNDKGFEEVRKEINDIFDIPGTS